MTPKLKNSEPGFFFILGLPRSRTAWLANWMTTDTTICLHDAWRFANTGKELRQLLFWKAIQAGVPQRYIGNSDSSNSWMYDILKETFPEARFALIERDYRDVEVSALHLSCAPEPEDLTGLLETLVSLHNAIKEADDDLFVTSFDSLEDPKEVRALQQHLMPQVPFNQARFDLMHGLKVIIHEPKYMESLKKCEH